MIHVTNQPNSAKFRQNGARAAVFPQHPTAFGVAQNEGSDARNSRSYGLRHPETANLPAKRSQHYLPKSGAPISETRGQVPVSHSPNRLVKQEPVPSSHFPPRKVGVSSEETTTFPGANSGSHPPLFPHYF